MTFDDRFPLPPGSTIGIMGGGQLGRMTALAAAPFGYRCHIFTPEADSPAEQVADTTTVAAYDNAEALRSFADSVDVVTFEFENVPHESVQLLADRVPVRPGWNVLRVSQDRLIEKDFINGLGIPTTPYRAVRNLTELQSAVADLGLPAVLKTTRLGYDGKGQVKIEEGSNLEDAWNAIDISSGGGVAILEAFADLAMEVSVIVARSEDNAWTAFPPVENRHVNHILDTTRAPAGLPEAIAMSAVRAALAIADELAVVGLLAVEMFITNDPKRGGVTKKSQLLINEIAPRPHNSGHWTIDACLCSQYEQFVRAVAGLPFGTAERHHDAVMKNLIGDEVDSWLDALHDPASFLHVYGKAEARPGRKMGHVTRLFPLGKLPRDVG
ncbi:MAG: 5-(carboxyamino)imidazole ribonucleotide synthase [Rhodospirillales bacterium]